MKFAIKVSNEMSAIRPNKNFDNEHKEHVPYSKIIKPNAKEIYDRIMKTPAINKKQDMVIVSDAGKRWLKKS